MRVMPTKFQPERLSFSEWIIKHIAPFYSRDNRAAYRQVYIPTGRNYLEESYNDEYVAPTTAGPSKRLTQHLDSNLTLITSFFGIPNRIILDGTEVLNGERVLLNLFGWHHANSPDWQKYLNYTVIFPLLKFTWNVVCIVSKTVWNIVKLATEYLPAVLEYLCLKSIILLKQKYDTLNWQTDPGKKLLCILGMAFSGVGYFAFKAWRWTGRAITSPWESVKTAWAAGKELGPLGYVLGFTLSVLSLAVTVTFYTIFFPLAIKAAIQHAPAVIASAVEWVANSSWAKALGNVVNTVIKPFAIAIKSIFQPSAWGLGLGATSEAGAGIAAIAVAARGLWKLVTNKLENWWHTRKVDGDAAVPNKLGKTGSTGGKEAILAAPSLSPSPRSPSDASSPAKSPRDYADGTPSANNTPRMPVVPPSSPIFPSDNVLAQQNAIHQAANGASTAAQHAHQQQLASLAKHQLLRDHVVSSAAARGAEEDLQDVDLNNDDGNEIQTNAT